MNVKVLNIFDVLLNEYENQKSDFYKTEKMKNKTVSEIKIKKDLNE